MSLKSIYLSSIIFLLSIFSTSAATITVCSSGCDHTTIQAAINAASNGDIIDVSAGTYNEVVTINKSLSMIGAGCGSTIIDGGGTNPTGISVPANTTNVSISNLTVQNTNGGSNDAGIRVFAGCDDLSIDQVCVENTPGRGGIYVDGDVDGIEITNSEVTGASVNGRGIVIWNGFKQNITITDNHVHDIGGCCGIELQDGSASGVTMSDNTVEDVGDSGMSAVGLTSGAGPNVISGNTITDNGRFGIEVKNPDGTGMGSGDGSIVVENNVISLTASISDMRDLAGIAVMRRALTGSNVDLPTGVIVRNNDVSGFQQTSDSDGFGIVVGGNNHTVENNTVSSNDVGIQQQAGHTPYPGNGDQSNLPDDYFGRDNSPAACGNSVGPNTFSSNGVNERVVGVSSGGLVTNINTSETFCSIQAAIDAPNTMDGHTITVAAGTYNEIVTINKPLSLLGPNAGISAVTGTRVPEARLEQRININSTTTQDVTVSGFEFWQVPAPTTWTIYIQGDSDNFTFENNRFIDCEKDAIRSGISSNTANITVTGNYIENITAPLASGILMGGINGTSLIADNKIDLEGNGYSGIQTPSATGLTISGNEILNTTNQGLQLAGACGDVVIENNSISNTNTSGGIDKGAIRLYGTAFTGPINVNNNVLTNSFNGVAIKDGEDIFGKDITIENNDLSGNINASIYNGASAGSVNAPCNWYGTSLCTTIENNVDGDVNYEPFLTSGGNSGSADPGFSPTGMCNGCADCGLATVFNVNTSEMFCSIQAGIDAVNTLTTHELAIPQGTYDESVDAAALPKDIQFAPGSSPGCVTITGNLTLNSGDVLNMEIDGSAPCTEHDQFVVDGIVDLGGATLNPVISYTFSPSDEIVIIDSDNPITGMFAEGTSISVGGENYAISYNNNEVTLSLSCGSSSYDLDVSISGALNIPSGSSTDLTADATGGSPAYSYAWSTSETTETITVSPSSTQNYSVTVTDDNGCTISETVTVEVGVIAISNICACDDGMGNITFNVTFQPWPTDPSELYDVGVIYDQTGGGTGFASVNSVPGDPSGMITIPFPSVSDAADPGQMQISSVLPQSTGVAESVSPDFVGYTISGPLVITTCPADRDINTEPGMCSGIVPDLTGEVVFEEDCGPTTVSQSPTAGSSFGSACGDEQVVTITVTDDGCMVSETCEVTLTLVDEEDPSLTGTLPGGDEGNACLSDAPAAPAGSVISAEYTDNCGTVSASLDGTNIVGDDCSWTVTYTYIVEDECSNTTIAEVEYTGGDTEAPSLTGTLPGGDEGNACLSDAPTAPAGSVISAEYTDNCGTVSASLDGTNIVGDDCSWTVTYTYIVEDECSNTTIADVEYTGGDTEAPSLTGTLPGGDEGNACLSNAPAAPAGSVISAEYTDNCGTVSASLDGTNTVGDDCSWTVTYTYIVEDECSNTTIAEVEYTGGDTEAPSLTGTLPGGDEGNACLSDAPTAPAGSVISAEYTDNCGTVSASLDGTNTVGDDCSWTVTYTYIVEDECSNTTIADVEYTGGDTEAPSLTGNLPPDGDQGNVCLDDAPDAPSESFIASAYTDNCGSVSATLEDTETTGTDCSWTVTYTYEVSDECANTTTVVFEYTGGDTEEPMLDGTLPGGNVGNVCLADAPAAPAGSVIADEFTDNCGVVSALLNTTDTSGDDCTGWTVTYTYIVSDECDNNTTA